MSPQSQKTLLYVDDEQEIVEIYGEFFEEQNFRVLRAYSGNQAQALLETEHVDVIVTDMQMPDGNGLELLAYTQKKKLTTPIIFTTGYSKVAREEALKLGAFDYFSKPFNEMVLLRRVEAAIEGKANLGKDSSQQNALHVLYVEKHDEDFELLRCAIDQVTHGKQLFKLERFKEGEHLLHHLLKQEQSGQLVNPDILLLNISLSQPAGQDLLQSLRENPSFRETSILMLTSSHDSEDRKNAKFEGVDGYFVKPHNQTAWNHLVLSWAQSWKKEKEQKVA